MKIQPDFKVGDHIRLLIEQDAPWPEFGHLEPGDIGIIAEIRGDVFTIKFGPYLSDEWDMFYYEDSPNFEKTDEPLSFDENGWH